MACRMNYGKSIANFFGKYNTYMAVLYTILKRIL